MIDGVSATKARVVLMSPTPFQNAGPVTDGYAKNTRLAEYTKAMGQVAAAKKVQFFDLFRHLTASDLEYTENGTHLGAAGYAETAGWVAGVEKPAVNEPLRKAIVAKNQLFFHRWRPEKHTYLFGFRKHEQGQNAKEVEEQLDPLVEKAEQEIDELRKKLK